MVALISLGTIINYLSRNSLAVLAPRLEGLLHLSTQQYSYVVGAFQVAYTAMQPVCGRIVDALGARTGFALFAALWSAASLLHAGVSGWGTLAAARGLLGATEASAVPTGIKAIGEWFKGPLRSAAVGWFNVGTSLGAMLAPPLTVALYAWGGWRAPFVAIGLIGFVWAAAWYALYRSPADLPGRQTEERPSLATLLSRRTFWGLAVPRFLAEPAWQTFSFWLPLYLAHERGWDLKAIALFAWLPFLAADLGGLAGGYLSPLLVRTLKLDLIRARVIATGVGAALMIAPGCVALAGSAFAAMALLCIGGFAHQLISVTINTLSADLFEPQVLGAANGWIGAAGWAGGLLFSLFIGAVVDRTGYGPLFACLGVFDLIGLAALTLLLRGARPVEADT